MLQMYGHIPNISEMHVRCLGENQTTKRDLRRCVQAMADEQSLHGVKRRTSGRPSRFLDIPCESSAQQYPADGGRSSLVGRSIGSCRVVTGVSMLAAVKRAACNPPFIVETSVKMPIFQLARFHQCGMDCRRSCTLNLVSTETNPLREQEPSPLGSRNLRRSTKGTSSSSSLTGQQRQGKCR